MKRKIITYVIAAVVAAAILALIHWAAAVHITIHNFAIVSVVSLFFITAGLIDMFISLEYEDEGPVAPAIVAIVLPIVAMIVMSICSSNMVNSRKLAKIISIEGASFEEVIPEAEDLANVSLMDTKTAKQLGDRVLGSLTDLVSQYEAGEYTTIVYKGEVLKIAPLQYTGFFKWSKRHDTSKIPGYIVVHTTDNEAEYISLEKGFTISPSAHFSERLDRVALKALPSGKFVGDYNFQLDEEGNPWWVVTAEEVSVGIMGHRIPVGAVIIDPYNGNASYYNLEDIPAWVDYVFTGEMAEKMYNWYGKYQSGWINSFASQTGVTVTTDDFGYLAIDDDIYTYTGVTSKASDESNLGFILCNSRTGEYKYVECAGAEEYSAMSAAEGQVQNYGYKASFPSLVNIDGEATYVMVLKDASGIIKMYAMVSAKNYTKVVCRETLNETLKAYVQLMNLNELPINEKNVLIEEIKYIDIDGNTWVYIKSAEETWYKSKFEENLLSIQVGEEVVILVSEEESEISLFSIS